MPSFALFASGLGGTMLALTGGLAIWVRSRRLSAVAYRTNRRGRLAVASKLATALGVLVLLGAFFDPPVIGTWLGLEVVAVTSIALGAILLAHAVTDFVSCTFVLRQIPGWDEAGSTWYERARHVDGVVETWLWLTRVKFPGGRYAAVGALLALGAGAFTGGLFFLPADGAVLGALLGAAGWAALLGSTQAVTWRTFECQYDEQQLFARANRVAHLADA